MQKQLSQRVAESAKPKDKRYQIHDTLIPGFILRVHTNGRKFWKLIQNQKQISIGDFPQMTFSGAQYEVKQILSGEKEIREKVPTVQQFLDDYYSDHLQSNHSRPNETIGYIERFNCLSTRLDEITLLSIETWRIKRKKKGNTPATINRAISALKAMLNKAVDLDVIDSNPIAKLKPLKLDSNKVIRYLSPDEEKHLYETLQDAKPYLKGIVTVALNTGLRRGELWNLCWKDVDLNKNMLVVHGEGAKSGQTRHVPINQTARMAFIEYLNGVHPIPALPVFGEHEFKKSWATLLKKADIQNFRFHDCRHHFASKLVMAGVELNVVRELLGHAKIDMTLRYAHLAPHNLKNAVELIG